MNLRVRIDRRTSRVQLQSEEVRLADLDRLIRETLLPGLSASTGFTLSLNGSEPLTDLDRTLASCGIVSGDLIVVLLPEAQRPPAQTSDRQQARSVWEPMLCGEAEDGQAPLSLDQLYHQATPTTPNDAVMVAAHLLMLETGFTPQDGDPPHRMPAAWRSSGVYRLDYLHRLCEGSAASVVAVTMGTQLVLNATLKVERSLKLVQKLQLQASDYLTDGWTGQSAAADFRDLKKFSRIFKDQLAYPLIAAAREAMLLPVAFGLPCLPPELLLRVLRLLDVRSLLRLSAVNFQLHAAAADSTLWRHLYRRDFPGCRASASIETDWKQLYVTAYRSRRQQRRRPVLPPFPFHDVINPPRPFFPPPGVIGGEYDQRPALPHSLLFRPRYPPTPGRASDIRRGFI